MYITEKKYTVATYKVTLGGGGGGGRQKKTKLFSRVCHETLTCCHLSVVFVE